MHQGLKLKNYCTGQTINDVLHEQEPSVQNNCTEKRCLGSMLLMPGYAEPPRPPAQVTSMAKEFLSTFFDSTHSLDSPAHTKRWVEVTEEIGATGTYNLTEAELLFGAKQAWRNASRCIGRIQWNNLKLFDARNVKTTKQMFDAICTHIEYATNKGNIRSTITVFPQRRAGHGDFRVWNSQLVSYAGYKAEDGSVIGDPINVEFTKVCIKLGWKGTGKQWEILPMILSNGSSTPDFFTIPPEIIMEVHLTHPTFDWFGSLGLRWYALPAVSGMLFDVGGIQFPAAPFNGWYMVTEVACRDLCDAQRFNILELVAAEMGEDTSSNTSMWKDRVLLEVNVAVLHSYQRDTVTMVDHHTASDSFVQHLHNEQKARKGCPADWVWIVPPMSGSLTSVFHQEMALYSIKPSYEYQVGAWLTHDWGDKKDQPPKYTLRHIARVVQASIRMFNMVLARRVTITILYGSETGRSLKFANEVAEVFSYGLNPKVVCMVDYDLDALRSESMVIVVTSTFGNGDGPENAQRFSSELSGVVDKEAAITMEPPASSSLDVGLSPLDTIKEAKGLLKNVRFSVFALGSSAYPHFCQFGHHIDNLLGALGGQRLLAVADGDELGGQEEAFRQWITSLYPAVCECFNVQVNARALKNQMSTSDITLTADIVRFVPTRGELLDTALSKISKKQVTACTVLQRKVLYKNEQSDKAMFLVDIASDEDYQPGDHVGIFPENRRELVDGILALLSCAVNPNQPVRTQIQDKRRLNKALSSQTWVSYQALPSCSLRILLSRFLDITTPLKPSQLEKLAPYVQDEGQKRTMMELVTDPVKYETWRNWYRPHLLEVMQQFPTLVIPPPLLVTILLPLQPRLYSISSSAEAYRGQIHVTVGVVKFNTKDGSGPVHYGVCSNYLDNISPGDRVYMFVRKSQNFALPTDMTKPVIMVGPGTGVAPFRGFWQQRLIDLQAREAGTDNVAAKGMWLFFGCRTREMDLYQDEKAEAVRSGALAKTFLALSREPKTPKTYVQDVILQQGPAIYRQLSQEGGHLYVCGDVTMADGVSQTLVTVAETHGNLTKEAANRFLKKLKEEKRYHEDIYGVVHFTAPSQKISEVRQSVEPSSDKRPSVLRKWFC